MVTNSWTLEGRFVISLLAFTNTGEGVSYKQKGLATCLSTKIELIADAVR